MLLAPHMTEDYGNVTAFCRRPIVVGVLGLVKGLFDIA
jgi:hypothetical protein